MTLFLHCPLLLPAKRSSCLTICPFLYHESLTMSESIDKVLFTTVFDCWFVTLKYHFLYFLSWATHNIPALPPHLHSWVVGLCYSQTILTTPFYFTVCRFHVAPFSPLRLAFSWTCFSGFRLQPVQEKGTLSAAVFFWQGDILNQRRLSIFTTKILPQALAF